MGVLQVMRIVKLIVSKLRWKIVVDMNLAAGMKKLKSLITYAPTNANQNKNIENVIILNAVVSNTSFSAARFSCSSVGQLTEPTL